MALLLRAWETRTISSEGSDFYEFLEMRLPFTPVQHPYPPLWTAGNFEAAGRGGHNLLVSVPVTPEVRARYDELRAASRAEPGHQNPHVTAPRIGQCQGVVIAETGEKAEAIARRSWSCYSESLMRAHGTVPPHLQTAIPEMDNPVAEIQLRRDPFEAERVVAGTPDRIRDYYVEQVRRGLANYFVLMLPFGDMTAEETATTLEGFITEVIPAVRKAETEVAS